MKRKGFLFALVCLLLLLLPTTALAAVNIPAGAPQATSSVLLSPFKATVVPTKIGEGKVTPLGKFHWRVEDRPMCGAISGDLNGRFSLVYDAVVNLLQSGYIWGTSEVNCEGGDTISGKVRGWTLTVIFRPLAHRAWIYISGTWTFSTGTGSYEGVWGSGTMSGRVGVQLDEENEHVVGILEGSQINLAGLWNK